MTRKKLLEIIGKAKAQQTDKLDLSNHGITELPEEIGQLKNLSQLYLSGNYLRELPKSLFQLRNLAMLYLNANHLAQVPEEIGQLKKLAILDLSQNQMSQLPRAIVQLKTLTILYLNNNCLSKLPTEMIHLKRLKVLDVDDNPLTFPPPEIVSQGLSAIRDYLKKSDKGGQILYEAKLMVVGQGGVGKTCLIERLIRDKYPEKKAITEGIRIQPWVFTAPDGTNTRITLNVWDFGGQEIYHATHQFFLTRHALYVLVWDALQEGGYDDRIYYWLNIITAFAEDSPILIVMNKSDQQSRDLNLANLRQQYPQIVISEKVSARNGAKTESLRALICRQAWDLPLMGTFWPSSWLAVRKALESASRHHVPYEKYLRLCQKAGIGEREAGTLSQYLHNLGIIMHFHNDPLLKDTIILKPEWGTDAVYKVLDAQPVCGRKGILHTKDLPEIWKDRKRYPPDKYTAVLRLMANFELAFPFGDDRHVIADFLPVKEDEYHWDPREPIQFEYHYVFLPAGMISRLFVRMYEHLIVQDGKPLCWRQGAYFQYKKSQAMIRISPHSKIVTIQVDGADKTAFLSFIREHFDALHKTIRKIRFREKIPCPCTPGCSHRFDYTTLLKYEGRKKKTITCEKSIEDISVKKLLDTIEHADARKEKIRKIARGNYPDVKDSSSPGISPKKWYQKIFKKKQA